MRTVSRIIAVIIMVAAGCLALAGLPLYLLIHLLHAPFGLDYPADLQALADAVWTYLLVDDAYILIGHDQLTMDEERHLLDVKQLLGNLSWVWMGSGALFLGYCIRSRYWQRLCVVTSKTGLTLLWLMLVTSFILGFNTSFLYFHRIFFCQIRGGLPVILV